MKENIKTGVTIIAKTTLKWLIVLTTGLLSSIMFFMIILFQNIRLAGGGHGNAIALMINLALNNPCAFILVVGSPIFILLYFLLANKIAIQSVLYLMWKNKAQNFVEGKIIRIVDKVTDNSEIVNSISNESILRLKLLQENNKDQEDSKIKKKVINYLFAKVKLDDIDFKNKDLKLSDIISTRISRILSEAVKPSYLFFWILLGIQLVLFIGAEVF
ncbi:hypothetical protein EYY60_10600 [Flavobacterium zhairuonense]|uniref:hypothetical protein n=1 Tax=Flavobacterium zhairuonense TaxID=2493631 RepID=UPI001052D5D5|nr:hypothetical protein [Flavobacterium zhairuonense]KAF2509963.1 hypothetical protein EYY60_10600 [Flavobacterium zhairuonense]